MIKISYRIAICTLAAATATASHAQIMYVALSNNLLQRFDLEGRSLSGFPLLDGARTIAVDMHGNTYATTNFPPEKNIKKYALDGTSLGTFATVGSDESHAIGLVFDELGDLYVGTNYCCRLGGRDTVERVAGNGTHLGTFATISTGPPGATFELVFDESGRLYAPDHNQIERFNVNGNSLGIFASTNVGWFITDLAFDTLGNLYALTLGGQIVAFDPTGSELGIVISDDDFSSLAIDEKDVLYVGGSNDIKMFHTDGTPNGVFVNNLSATVLDIEFARVVPEPSSVIVVLIGAFGYMMPLVLRCNTTQRRRRPCNQKC